MTIDPIDQLADATGAVARLIAGVPPRQWNAPTPCTEWNVGNLVTHMIESNERFAAILSGGAPPLPGASTAPAVDSDADPLTAYRGSAAAMLEAFRRPGVLDSMFEMPIGSVPGVVALHLRITEALTHGWDIARATSQPPAFPDPVVRQELEFTRSKLGDVAPGRTPFAPPHPVAESAPPLDQLVACLGRDPNWLPPT